MKTQIFPLAVADITRQFRLYLVEQDAPLLAERFRQATNKTIERSKSDPRIGEPVRWTIPGLRSWPVKNFEAVRIYYRENGGTLQIIRLLHGKRNVRRILIDSRPEAD